MKARGEGVSEPGTGQVPRRQPSAPPAPSYRKKRREGERGKWRKGRQRKEPSSSASNCKSQVIFNYLVHFNTNNSEWAFCVFLQSCQMKSLLFPRWPPLCSCPGSLARGPSTHTASLTLPVPEGNFPSHSTDSRRLHCSPVPVSEFQKTSFPLTSSSPPRRWATESTPPFSFAVGHHPLRKPYQIYLKW